MDNKIEVLDSGVEKASADLVDKFLEMNPEIVVVERFVSYKGKQVDMEKVNRFIGMLEYAFRDKKLILVKAIDWQISVLKKLKALPPIFGKGRKKFSAKATVKQYFRKTFKSEHEADAFLLAYYGLSIVCTDILNT